MKAYAGKVHLGPGHFGGVAGMDEKLAPEVNPLKLYIISTPQMTVLHAKLLGLASINNGTF